jgi:pimeloyl-ACP methyl ester carboxylesterase
MTAQSSLTELTPKSPVIFIHGFLSKRLLMKPLEWQVARRGFPTSLWGYASYSGSLRKHAARLRPVLEQANAANKNFHVVAHSMGSIVLRLALQEGPLPNLGRVVLMAPPNHGIPAAKWVGLFFKGVSELSDDHKGLILQIQPNPSLELGIIAARYDWVVPPSRTLLAAQQDHICLVATHNSMLIQRAAARQVAEFLEKGQFARQGKENHG